MLSRTEPSQRFYIKVDWSKDGMGDVLSQEGGSVEALKEEAQEKSDGKCEFDKSL